MNYRRLIRLWPRLQEQRLGRSGASWGPNPMGLPTTSRDPQGIYSSLFRIDFSGGSGGLMAAAQAFIRRCSRPISCGKSSNVHTEFSKALLDFRRSTGSKDYPSRGVQGSSGALWGPTLSGLCISNQIQPHTPATSAHALPGNTPGIRDPLTWNAQVAPVNPLLPGLSSLLSPHLFPEHETLFMSVTNEKGVPSDEGHTPKFPASSTDEKGSISHTDRLNSDVENFDKDEEFGGPDNRRRLEKKLLLKVDLRMSILVVIYILNYIDRNNAAAARLRGFEADLHLTGKQFPTLLSILYVGYIIMQVPSNMFLNWIGKPSLYLPACMIVWGTISVLTGITHNFVGALLTRFFLGFVEAAFFPGALFLLSKWYKREELGLRTAILYVGNIISNGFGTLMASGILNGMEGKLGHAAWRWLFYIEGGITIAVAVLAIFVLPDFPTTSKWLSPQERSLAVKRMEEDGGVNDEESESAGSGLLMALLDWRVWFIALALTSQVVALSFNAYFPTLTATLGYNRTVTLLLCAPPWAFAALVTFFVSRHSDQVQERFYHIMGSYITGIIGFIIAISTMNTAARYISLFLMAQSYAGFVVLYAWISNSFPRPPSKRAVALALINAFSQLGNIAGSYVWPTAWGPTYRYSYGICIATSGLAIAMCFVFKLHLQSLNRKAEAEEKANGAEKQGFRYIL